MSEKIILEQDKLRTGKWIFQGFGIGSILGFFGAFSAIYFLVIGVKVRYGIISYLYVSTGSVIIIILSSWALYNSIRIMNNLDGKALSEFKKKVLQNEHVILRTIQYSNGYYTLRFADHFDFLIMDIPIELIIQENLLNQLIDVEQQIDNKPHYLKIETDGENNRNYPDNTILIAARVIDQLCKEDRGVAFLIALKYAKERHPGQVISYEKLHPLLVDHVAKELAEDPRFSKWIKK